MKGVRGFLGNFLIFIPYYLYLSFGGGGFIFSGGGAVVWIRI